MTAHTNFSEYVNSFLAAMVIFLIFVYQVYKKRQNKEKRFDSEDDVLGLDDIPAIETWIPWKFIGFAGEVFPLNEFLKKGEMWSNKYGDLITTSAFCQKFVGFNSGPVVQTVLQSADFGHLNKSPIIYDRMNPLIINGVLVSKGTFWQKQRKLLMKSQSFQNLKGYIGMLNRHSNNLVQNLKTLFEDGKSHQINEVINTAFLGVISEMITGKNLDGSKELVQYHHNFTVWKECTFKRMFNPLLLLKPIWYFHPLAKEYDKAVPDMIDFAKRRLKEHKDERKQIENKKIYDDDNNLKRSEGVSKLKFRCVLDELLDAGVDDKQIVDEIDTLMFGGHETGASAIHFLCFSLALNPKYQEEARQEVDELFNDPTRFPNEQITFEVAQGDLKYVERCIQEGLRLFPPVLLYARKLSTPLTTDYNGKNLVIPAGVNAVVCPITLHRRPEYFPDPHKFDPDRFLPEEVAKRHAYAYVPFSAGPRNCLGLKFAMIEMKMVMAYILRNFEITTTDKMEDIPLLPHITLTPERDYYFNFKKRNI